MIIRPAYAMMFVVMSGQSLQTSATRDETLDTAAELARLELLLSERQDELTKLQQELQKFKVRYTRIVGSQLSELAEIEACIREAEARLRESDDEAAPEDAEAKGSGGVNGTQKAAGGGLRKLFWSVASSFIQITRRTTPKRIGDT
jgi:septal ring factor EnvC (AmiA/AmiB activator)